MARLDPTGVSRILSYIKTWVTNALGGKANSSHSHSDYIPKSGGEVLEGQDFKRTVDNSTLNVYGGQGYGHGAFLQLTGTGDAGAGEFNIQAHDGVNSKVLKGKADGTLTWGGTAISLNGHTHTKSQITDFPTIPTNTNQLTNGAGFITSSGSCNYANSTGYVQGNNNSANAANALLRSGSGRTDSSPEGDTWIFLDSIGGSDAPWGFKHNQGANTIGFYGAGTETSSINLSTGHFSGTAERSNSSGYADSAGGVAWDNVSGKPSAFTPYFANGTWYAVGDDAAIGDHNVGGGLGVKALNSTTTRIDFCYKDDASNYKSITYDGTTLYMNGNCNYADSAGNSDTLDGYHEYSFLRYRGNTSTSGEGTLWAQIGIKDYNNALPDGLSGVYQWGEVVSLAGGNGRFEIYCSHNSSNGNGLYYRSGWYNDKKDWRCFIDSANIGSQSVNYATSAGSAGSVAWSNVSGRPTAVSQFTNDSEFWSPGGGKWNPNANISLTASGSNQEWSFDIRQNGNSGCYWHVWSDVHGSMLRVDADNGAVSVPRNIFYLGSYKVYVG